MVIVEYLIDVQIGDGVYCKCQKKNKRGTPGESRRRREIKRKKNQRKKEDEGGGGVVVVE